MRAFPVPLGVLLALQLGCSPRVTAIGESSPDAIPGVFIEAETGTLTGDFAIGSDSRASGGRFIYAKAGATFDNTPGAAHAQYELLASTAGTYLIWGRIHTQNISENRFWFQLDDGDWTKWRITTGDDWFWDAFHTDTSYSVPLEFKLTAGPHQLVIANCVDDAALDRLYFAPNAGLPEPKETACNPPHSVDLDGGCAPSCGSLGGLCGAVYCKDLPTTATYDCPDCCPPQP